LELGSFSLELLSVFFLVAVLAGFIDTLAGGGGLITMPALILAGLPPLAALATNKLQGSMGTATSALMMLKKRRVRWGSVRYLMLSAFIGSGVGTLAVQLIDTAVLPVIGCYDGMFGPGTGSFFALSGVSCRGQDLLTSTAQAKPLNFATNIASLTVFLLGGHIVWVAGLCMMLGQALGAWLGAHCLFRINPVWLRRIVVLVCGIMLARYAWSMGWFGLA